MALQLLNHEKRYLKMARKKLVFGAGLAVCETGIKQLSEIHKEMLTMLHGKIGEFDPCSSESEEIFVDERCRRPMAQGFKDSLFPPDKLIASKLWKDFKGMKSLFLNHWVPHFEIRSGEDLEDALERIRKHEWVRRQNKSIAKKNSDEPDQRKHQPMVTLEDVPEKNPATTYFEMATFRAYHNHDILKKTATSTAVPANVTGTAAGTAEDDDNEEAPKNVARASRFITRKQQRAREASASRKRKKMEASATATAMETVANAKKMRAEAQQQMIDIEKQKNMLTLLKIYASMDVQAFHQIKHQCTNAIFGSVIPTDPTVAGVATRNIMPASGAPHNNDSSLIYIGAGDNASSDDDSSCVGSSAKNGTAVAKNAKNDDTDNDSNAEDDDEDEDDDDDEST